MLINREELMKLEKEEIIDLLLGIIQQLTERVAELEARLNQNSKNSSKPPSSDGFHKPKSLRKPSGKKAGGQVGHEGSGLKLLNQPKSYVQHKPENCISCLLSKNCLANEKICETRYEIDININTETTAHQLIEIACPKSGQTMTGKFPDNINSTMQYGVNLEALAVSLNTSGMVSVNRTHEILSDVFGIPISTGTISSMVTNCAQKVEGTVNEIKDALIDEPLINVDETGVRVDKQTVWAHVASTNGLTHISVQEKRGKEGMNAIGLLLAFLGTVIHDCWAAYFSFKSMRHGLCNAHLLRELTAVVENAKQAWAQSLIDLLLEMKQAKEKLLNMNLTCASKDCIEKHSATFDRLLADALLQNPIPARESGKKGKIKRGKTGALVDRLIIHKEKYLLFFTDFSVPFDNNLAERDFRMLKVKLKVSGCFRTMDGARDFASIMSYTSTARKRGISAYIAIRDALISKPFSIANTSSTAA